MPLRSAHRSIHLALQDEEPVTPPEGLAGRISDAVLSRPIPARSRFQQIQRFSRAAAVLLLLAGAGFGGFELGSQRVMADVDRDLREYERYLDEEYRPEIIRQLGLSPATAEAIVNLRYRFHVNQNMIKSRGGNSLSEELRKLFDQEQAAILNLLSPAQRQSYAQQMGWDDKTLRDMLAMAAR